VGYRRRERTAILEPPKVVRCPMPRYHPSFCCYHPHFAPLVVQWLGVGLVIERSLVRLPDGALSSQLGQLSLPSLQDR